MQSEVTLPRRPRPLWPYFLTAGFAIVIAAGVVSSRWESMKLRTEIAVLRFEVDELERLRSANKRLRAKQIPAAEIEKLRADHAALPRLRAEIETLKERAKATGR